MKALTNEEYNKYLKQLQSKIDSMPYSYYIEYATWIISDNSWSIFYYYPLEKVVVITSEGTYQEITIEHAKMIIATFKHLETDYTFIEGVNENMLERKRKLGILENAIKEAIVLLEKEGINSKQKAKELLEKSLDEYYTYKR